MGFSAQGFDISGPYRRLPDSFDPRAAFIFAGVGRDEVIGDFGLIGNGRPGWSWTGPTPPGHAAARPGAGHLGRRAYRSVPAGVRRAAGHLSRPGRHRKTPWCGPIWSFMKPRTAGRCGQRGRSPGPAACRITTMTITSRGSPTMSCNALSIPSRSASPNQPGELRHPPGRVWLVLLGLVFVYAGGQPSWADPAAQNSAQDPIQAASPDTSAMIEAGSATIHTLIEGQGRPVVLLPALGRGVADFGDLSIRLVAAGFQVVRPQPAGHRRQHGSDDRPHPARPGQRHRSRHSRPGQRPGHPGRPRPRQPHRPRGGHRSPPAGQQPGAAGGRRGPAHSARGPARPADVLRPQPVARGPTQAYSKSLFCRRQRSGRLAGRLASESHPDTAERQPGNHSPGLERGRQRADPPAPGREDKIAPLENARRFKQRHGSRVTLIEIGQAGHALLPEQPQAIAEAIVHFLQR